MWCDSNNRKSKQNYMVFSVSTCGMASNEQLYTEVHLLQDVIQRKLKLFGHVYAEWVTVKISNYWFWYYGWKYQGRSVTHEEWADDILHWWRGNLQELSYSTQDRTEWNQIIKEASDYNEFKLYDDSNDDDDLLYTVWQVHVHETKQQIPEWAGLRADHSDCSRRHTAGQSHWKMNAEQTKTELNKPLMFTANIKPTNTTSKLQTRFVKHCSAFCTEWRLTWLHLFSTRSLVAL